MFVLLMEILRDNLQWSSTEFWAIGLLTLSFLFTYTLYYIPVYTKIVSNREAALLSLLFPGFGQLALRQKLVGFLFMIGSACLLQTMIYTESDASDIWKLAVLFGPPIVSARFAYLSVSRTMRQINNQQKQEIAVLNYKLVEPGLQKGMIPALDTNILMHSALLLVAMHKDSNAHLLLSKQVFFELEGLKKSKDPVVRKRAQLGFDMIELFQSSNRLKMLDIPGESYRRKWKLSNTGDDKIIASYLRELENRKTPLGFLSNDKGARILARNAGLPIFER
ncbi:PIN domain-containing protein [Sediminibacillus massiliensis]|uniref:PIN domain-containing protein n=1 Tax=Sediminibacillus massiliensis TaxID=1926277 RepID=UPI0009884B0F|nr:PIN domain-containing protein [Sediminibacillus massiliensis]